MKFRGQFLPLQPSNVRCLEVLANGANGVRSRSMTKESEESFQPETIAPKPHPTASPPTLNIQFVRPWTILRPRLYRYLPSKWVDAFFHDGSLRLSSFNEFSKHTDEQRADPQEGRGVRVGVGIAATIVTATGRGHDCYV